MKKLGLIGIILIIAILLVGCDRNGTVPTAPSSAELKNEINDAMKNVIIDSYGIGCDANGNATRIVGLAVTGDPYTLNWEIQFALSTNVVVFYDVHGVFYSYSPSGAQIQPPSKSVFVTDGQQTKITMSVTENGEVMVRHTNLTTGEFIHEQPFTCPTRIVTR